MKMQFMIRRGNQHDAEVVADFNARMAKETEGLELDGAVLLAGVKQILSDASKGHYFVAEADGKVIGQLMITYEWSDWRNGWVWWIQSVYVAPEYRRQGIYRALYEYVSRCAPEAGVKAIRLYVDRHNKIAQQTYSNLGMKESNYIIYEQAL